LLPRCGEESLARDQEGFTERRECGIIHTKIYSKVRYNFEQFI